MKERRELPAKSHKHYLAVVGGVEKPGATGGRCGGGGGNSSIIKARNPFFWSKVKVVMNFRKLITPKKWNRIYGQT